MNLHGKILAPIPHFAHLCKLWNSWRTWPSDRLSHLGTAHLNMRIHISRDGLVVLTECSFTSELVRPSQSPMGRFLAVFYHTCNPFMPPLCIINWVFGSSAPISPVSATTLMVFVLLYRFQLLLVTFFFMLPRYYLRWAG